MFLFISPVRVGLELALVAPAAPSQCIEAAFPCVALAYTLFEGVTIQLFGNSSFRILGEAVCLA
jgi:hypothetical protein